MERIGRLFLNIPHSQRDLLIYALVFGICFITAKIGLFIYYGLETSPALIYPSVGMGLVAVLFGGYRMGIPIFLGHVLALITHTPDTYVVSTIIAAAHTLQAVMALYVMRQFGFERELDRLRNTQIFVGVAFLVTLIEPMIASVAQEFFWDIADPLLNLGRAWGGGIFSALVIAPFVITWFPWQSFRYTRNQWLEIVAAFITLASINYFVFWTEYPQNFGVAVLFFVPAVLIWFALSLHVRWLTLGIVLTAAMGILGSIISYPGDTPMNAQLLAVEIYIGLMVAIFLLFVAVVEERRAAYYRLQSAYQSTYAADKAKNEFIAILAHELRNPLAPIVTSLELLRLEPQTPDALQTLRNAEDHTGMIRRLLDDLLDTARLSQQKFNLQKESVHLKSLVDQSIASVSDLIRSKNHSFHVEMPSDDTLLYVDPVRIKQIVINLLNNAVKYTKPQGTIRLCVTATDRAVTIEVSDNGIGIDGSQLDGIFEPFKQVNASSKHTTGLGIGLFLTQRLTEMHDGTIAVRSDGLGRGSVFTVTLPLPETVSPPETEGSPISTGTAHYKILIIDDNAAAANALQKLLRIKGHDVVVSYSGRHGLQVTDLFKPDVLLLDIGMPEMNGYEVARALREKGWKGKIIALTGYGQSDDKMESELSGFDSHLVKPVNIADINRILADLRT